MPAKEELSVNGCRKWSFFMSLSDDKSLTSDEFLLDWQERCLGSSLEGVILFHHLDVDRNGHIEDTDIPWVMNYFDGNCKSLSFYHYIIHLSGYKSVFIPFYVLYKTCDMERNTYRGQLRSKSYNCSMSNIWFCHGLE